ncbi:hypothetical protein Ssi03_73900 [Sphaerisporangium siamense]|uniref:Uncharacterized protein n=1 Tax=Sphaerisporangium siamense TaxID=795645 RepID=A0A7W7GEH4_9ACTN|nr:hypothetical protein [Sphaerisporangium siamense]MBB4706105.1 hypothetical protein [Sphaerisporangium siamense]GII89400.1 hypothetical protein Ssi03_73900 [Sphaerisporangium siamense]
MPPLGSEPQRPGARSAPSGDAFPLASPIPTAPAPSPASAPLPAAGSPTTPTAIPPGTGSAPPSAATPGTGPNGPAVTPVPGPNGPPVVGPNGPGVAPSTGPGDVASAKELLPARSAALATGTGVDVNRAQAGQPGASGAVPERPPFVPPGAVPPPEPPSGAPEGNSRKRVVLVAGVAVAVAAVGTAAVFGYQALNRDSAPVSLPEPLPSVDVVIPEPTDLASPEPSPVVTTVLNSEKTDPKKLTLKEAFSQQKVTVQGRAYVRAKVDLTAQWQKAAVGTFATALKKAGCTRVLRATYVDGKRRYAVTTGIAVFPTKQAAVAVDKKKDLAKTVWFRGLAGDAGSGADKADIAGGYASGLVWGRYIIFSFATYADGHTPTAAEKDLAPISGAFRDQTAKVIQKRLTG